MAIHKVTKLLMFMVLALSLWCAVPAASGSPAPPFVGEPHSSAYLGVMVDNVSPEKAAALHLADGSGAAISGIDQDGPACKAGLKNGDIVVAFNGKSVQGAEQFASLIHASAPGTTATMSILRDGRSQVVRVTLGDWNQMAKLPKPPVAHGGSMAFVPPVPPVPPHPYPDVEVPSFTQLYLRHGLAVEPLSPQLAEFFGVPQNNGVLVRSVDKNSPAAAAGIKAGDVIVRVNKETIHDMADWRRAMKSRTGKVTIAILRDRKERTVELILPANSSELRNEDGSDLDTLAELDLGQLDEIHRQAESAAKSVTPEMKKQMEDLRKQSVELQKQAEIAAKTMTPEMKKQAEELHKQAVVIRKQSEQMRKEVERMTPEMARTAREMADSMKPTAKELSDMARDMAQQWKEMQPELQQQMQQLKKELEQEKREWQEIFKGSGSKQQL